MVTLVDRLSFMRKHEPRKKPVRPKWKMTCRRGRVCVCPCVRVSAYVRTCIRVCVVLFFGITPVTTRGVWTMSCRLIYSSPVCRPGWAGGSETWTVIGRYNQSVVCQSIYLSLYIYHYLTRSIHVFHIYISFWWWCHSGKSRTPPPHTHTHTEFSRACRLSVSL